MNQPNTRRRCAIIAAKDSFFISGLTSKLLEIGVGGVVVPPDMQIINKSVTMRDPLIYYLGDEVFKHTSEEFLTSLREACLESKRMLILIGDDPEYQMVTKYIPKSAIVEWFQRPVDLDKLLGTLQNCYSGKVKVAGKRRILIVDDDTTFMRMMHETLKDYYMINMLTSGKQAFLWLETNRPDLILLDYEMPDTNGVEVYTMLKENKKYKHIPIIFLTGKQDKNSVLDALNLSPKDYILKSVDQKSLIDRLEEIFKNEVPHSEYDDEFGESLDGDDPNDIAALLASMNMH